MSATVIRCSKCGIVRPHAKGAELPTSGEGHHVIPGDPEDWICYADFVEEEKGAAVDALVQVGPAALDAQQPTKSKRIADGAVDTAERNAKLAAQADAKLDAPIEAEPAVAELKG